ncbi:hypothetical protein [Brevibacterium casei]|uniref:Uncharacterized protein n=1 Tax=Brevibacterium casei TaxID=33889 RepID=A0AB34XT83_9MICO|nr:hypothetical protein [Brevibacterium casei]KZE19144.1 hypothetical protein AVW13_11855 [Brevibacterium casei]
MTDTRIETWLAERRSIHAAATEGPWEAYEGPGREPANILTPQHTPIPMINGCCDGDGYLDNPADVVSIVDAHNHLPALVQGWEAVLRLHQPVLRGNRYVCEHCHYEDGPVVTFPCLTVRALEAVIGDD